MQPQITIHVSTPDSPDSVYSFAQPKISIGRVQDHRDGANDIVLAAPRVSGRHAHVIVTRDGLTLVDHSANGTLVNGELLAAPRLLTAADRVEIDAYTLRFEVSEATVDVPPRAAPSARPREDQAQPPPPPPRRPAEVTASHPPLSLVPEDDLPDIHLPTGASPQVTSDDLREAEVAGATVGLPETHSATHSATPTPGEPSFASPPDLSAALVTSPSVPPPASIPPLPSAPAPSAPSLIPGDPLARLYRSLAGSHGAAWGQPPPLDKTSLARVTALAREAADRLPEGPWPEHIARELCGLGPLAPLLDDPAVTRVIVRGTDPIEVSRGSQRERTRVRFSCTEAIHAVVERWTGSRLAGALDLLLEGGVRLHAWGPPLSASGPLLILERLAAAPPTLADLVADRVLPEGAAELLRLALQRDLNILIHGPPAADLGALLVALAGEVPSTSSLCVLRRGSIWPLGHATIIDGHDAAAWPCARRLASDWLVVDEVEPGDLADLVALARHPGGGTLATLRAPTPEAALQRLAALFTATAPGDLSAARNVVGGCFDAVVDVQRTPATRPRVRSIAEIRARGELAELFAWHPDVGAVEPTAVDPQVIR